MNVPRILIVDDIADARILLERIVKDVGLIPEPVSSGAEAVEKLKIMQDIRLVLLDLHLEDMNGFEVLHQINLLRQEGSMVSVIIVTGRRSKEDVLKGVQMQADDYVVKPVDPTSLRDKIRTLLRMDTINDDFAWIQGHFLAHLEGAAIKFPFIITALCEARLRFEASMPFVEGRTFSFLSNSLAETIEGFPNPVMARVDSVRVFSKMGQRYDMVASFIGLNQQQTQIIRNYSMRQGKQVSHPTFAKNEDL